MVKKLMLSAAFGLLLGACGSGKEAALNQLTQRVNSAKHCVRGDQCVLAGSSHCSCAAAVNVSASNGIAEAVAEVNRQCSSSEFLAECVLLENPRCDVDAEQCVADVR